MFGFLNFWIFRGDLRGQSRGFSWLLDPHVYVAMFLLLLLFCYIVLSLLRSYLGSRVVWLWKMFISKFIRFLLLLMVVISSYLIDSSCRRCPKFFLCSTTRRKTTTRNSKNWKPIRKTRPSTVWLETVLDLWVENTHTIWHRFWMRVKMRTWMFWGFWAILRI